jgi:hypothetical protein
MQRFEALAAFFQSGLSPTQAARLYSQLLNPGDPLRKLMDRRLTARRVPELIDILRRTSLGYSAETAPEDLDDVSLRGEFLDTSDRLTHRPAPAWTSLDQAVAEARGEELFQELARRGIAETEASPWRLEEIDRLRRDVDARLADENRSRLIRELSAESGLDVAYVAAFLAAYEQQTRPRFPGTIDPRGVPFIQLTAPLIGIADIMKDFIPVVSSGIALYEAVRGRALLSNQELAVWERGLRVALVVLPLSVKGLSPATRKAAQVLRSLSAAAARPAAQMAALAVRLGATPRTMLRFLGRITRLPARKIRDLYDRIAKARKAGKNLEVSDEEAAWLRQVDEAFQEFSAPERSRGARAAAPSLKIPTAKGFIFLSREQPLVLGQLLGRRLTASMARSVRPALRAAEEAAADLTRRIRAHWDAAVSRSGESAATAARRVFGQLRAANPGNANQWVRDRLYALWRERAMGRIARDQALREDLGRLAGITVGQNPKTGTVSMHIRTKSTSGHRTQTPLDFDHDAMGHAQAVRQALRDDDFRLLISTVDSDNLQLLTGRENRNFIEALRTAMREMVGESGP